MQRDDETLVERRLRDLVAAGYGEGDGARELVARELLTSDTRLRVLALRAAARRGWLDAGQWSALVRDDDVLVRRDATRLLAYEAAPAANTLEALDTALDDDDALVVERAAFALGEHRHAKSLEHLVDVAGRHDDPRCRESAVAALGALGDERALATIVAALEDKAPIRRRAVVALSNFEGPEVDAALELASDDRDWQVRAAVAQLRREEFDES